MRKVSRTSTHAPEVLFAEGAKGAIEKTKAVEYFKKWPDQLEPDDKPPKFAAYKDKSVALALNALFHGKCAYCESRFAGIHPVDIEHWRPKGDVFLEDGSARGYGYYWLAATWDNLLPSCIDCNRVRTHKDFVTEQQTTLGKGNWFPVSDEKNRSKEPDTEADEAPLLLNPAIDDPMEYLEFCDNGCVSPRTGTDEYQRKRAIASIRFYALNRTELVQDRRARLLLIRQKMNIINELARILEEEDPPEEIGFLIDDILAFELESLDEFKRQDQPFSSMAHQIIEHFMDGFRPRP